MLRGYLTRLFLVRFLGALFGLACILQLLDLIDQASTILAHAGLSGIARYAGLRLPTLLTGMVPLAALIGALLTFLRLSAGLEVTAMRAAGLGIWQVLRRLLPAGVAVCLAGLAMQAELAPRTERAFADWWARVAPPGPGDAPPARLWMRAHGDMAAIQTVSLDGDHLGGVLILQRSATGDLDARLDAKDASFKDGHWTLHDVRVARPDRVRPDMQASVEWPHGPSPANMVELSRPVAAQTVGRLLATLRGSWVGGRGPEFYVTQAHALLASAAGPLLMVLLAAPVLLHLPRAGGASLPVARCLALGLAYLTVSGLLVALGGAGVLPEALAGWTALLAFGTYGWLALAQAEDQG